MTDSTLCLYHLLHTFTLYFLRKAQWMFKDTLSCLLLYSFCANILQPLTMGRTFSTCVPHNLHLLLLLLLLLLTFYTKIGRYPAILLMVMHFKERNLQRRIWNCVKPYDGSLSKIGEIEI